MGNPVGRPSKYTSEMLEQARGYLMGEWQAIGDAIPSLAGLACYLGLSRETVNAWSNDPSKEDFSDIANGILVMQERELVNRGLLKQFDSSITKLILGKHGYTDKVQQDLTSSDGTMTPVTVVFSDDPQQDD